MFDLKVLNSALSQLEEEKGIPKEKILGAIEDALAAAYKKEHGKRGQIIRSKFDPATGKAEFFKVKIVVDESIVKKEEDDTTPPPENKTQKEAGVTQDEIHDSEEKRVNFNEEHHIMIEDAKKIKKDIAINKEIIFPLETKSDYGRIAAQTAKQVIMQRLREAEKVSVLEEYSEKRGGIVAGSVQRVERGNVLVDLGRATAILPKDEQIPGEYYRQGERIKALLISVEETPRGVDLKLSRSHPEFLAKLFEVESPEITNGTVVVEAIAREAGARSKIAVSSRDENIDPVGSLVGQRGIRVNTVINELGGEKIDIIEWSESPETFITQALSPAKVLGVNINEKENVAKVEVEGDQFSLAIGRRGQNVRLAAKLTGRKIDIFSPTGETISQSPDGEETGEEDTTRETQKESPKETEQEKGDVTKKIPEDKEKSTKDELKDTQEEEKDE